MCTTMPMKRILPSWTSSLENLRCLVSCNVTRFQWNLLICPRIRKVSKDDLVGLHLRLWRHLRTLPWNQLRLRRWNPLLVLHQALQEVLIHYQHKSVSICNIFGFLSVFVRSSEFSSERFGTEKKALGPVPEISTGTGKNSGTIILWIVCMKFLPIKGSITG